MTTINIKKKCEYKKFLKGEIKNPYDKTVLGVGCIGETCTKINGVFKKSYKHWKRLMERCYDTKHYKKYKTYKRCYVCDEWLCFANFEKWFKNNYYEIDGQIMELDKDILIKGNNIYSPETAIFVPHEINYLFIKKQNYRGSCMIGVCYHSRDKKYTASCNITVGPKKYKRIHLGYYNDELSAFYTYKEFKEKHIKNVAEKYKDFIPTKLYLAMLNYTIDYDD